MVSRMKRMTSQCSMTHEEEHESMMMMKKNTKTLPMHMRLSSQISLMRMRVRKNNSMRSMMRDSDAPEELREQEGPPGAAHGFGHVMGNVFAAL